MVYSSLIFLLKKLKMLCKKLCLISIGVEMSTVAAGNALSSKSVFSKTRDIVLSHFDLPKTIKLNKRLRMDGLDLLKKLPEAAIPVAFLDPQYRGVLNKMAYGNEGEGRGKARCLLKQMDDDAIASFIRGIDRVLMPTGHLFLWLDKFELLNGFRTWLDGTDLDVVDLVNWDKGKMGMGYRSRRVTEYCVVAQKQPRKAKGVWRIHNIRDTWCEKAPPGKHPHRKPINLQADLLSAVTNEGDIVLDPCAGDFTVMTAAQLRRRNFLGVRPEWLR